MPFAAAGTESNSSQTKCLGSFPKPGAADEEGGQGIRLSRGPPGMFDKCLSGLGGVQWLAFLCPGLASLVFKIGYGYTHTHTHTHTLTHTQNAK